MRSRNIFLGILIILFSFASHSAVAQNIFEKDVENRNIKNLSQDPRALDPKLRHSEASPEGYRLRSQEERTENIAPNISRHAVNVYAPMAGLSDTLFSQAHADQLSTILSSPVVLYSTTMLLTEPAVAGGVNNALSHAHGSLHSRYLAEEQFMRQLDSNPETKQVSLRNYSDCVANYIRERTKFPVQPGSPPMPDFTNDTVSWIEAQSKCMADRIKSVDSIGGTQFNQVGDTPTALTGKGFDFANEITNPKFHNNSTATGLEDSQIYLTDYIFNQFDYSSFGVSILGLRSAFEQLLGNYIFTLDRETGGVRSASRELKYRKTAPTRPRDEWLLEKEESIYGKLMFILGEYCSFQPAPTTTRNTGFPDEYTFCKSDPSVENTLMELSVPGFQLNCATLEMLYNGFQDNHDLFRSPSERNCAYFTSPESYDVLKFDKILYPGESNIVFLVTEIALAQAYLTLIHIKDIVDNMTGANSYFAQSFAYSLINEATGNTDLYANYRAILNNIRSFRDRIQDTTTLTSGSRRK